MIPDCPSTFAMVAYWPASVTALRAMVKSDLLVAGPGAVCPM